jgi:hypothetical protein
MRLQRQSEAHDTHTRGWRALVAAQELAPRPNQHGANRPFREPPGLLTAAEVEHGLAARHRALRERFLAHEQQRRQQPADDYAIPAPPPNVPAPPRPDAPGGEFDAAGVR